MNTEKIWEAQKMGFPFLVWLKMKKVYIINFTKIETLSNVKYR